MITRVTMQKYFTFKELLEAQRIDKILFDSSNDTFVQNL